MLQEITRKNNKLNVKGYNYSDEETFLITSFSFMLDNNKTYLLSEFITEVKNNFDNKKVLKLCNDVMEQNIIHGV